MHFCNQYIMQQVQSSLYFIENQQSTNCEDDLRNTLKKNQDNGEPIKQDLNKELPSHEYSVQTTIIKVNPSLSQHKDSLVVEEGKESKRSSTSILSSPALFILDVSSSRSNLSLQSSNSKLKYRNGQNIQSKQSQIKDIANIQQIDYEEASESQQQDLKSKDIKQISLTYIPQQKMVKCIIKRTSSLFSLKQTFQLYLFNQKKLLMRAVKNKISLHSEYDIFVLWKNGEQRIGKVISNFTRSQYKLIQINEHKIKKETFKTITFDHDIPSFIKLRPIQIQTESQISEEQRCYISFEKNYFGQKKVCFLKYRSKELPQTERFSKIKTIYQQKYLKYILKLTNKLAEKNKEGLLVLNFKAENLINSSKNVILQDEFGRICLTCGKQRESLYLLNVMQPFNLFEAFFFGICNFDNDKIFF